MSSKKAADETLVVGDDLKELPQGAPCVHATFPETLEYCTAFTHIFLCHVGKQMTRHDLAEIGKLVLDG